MNKKMLTIVLTNSVCLGLIIATLHTPHPKQAIKTIKTVKTKQAIKTIKTVKTRQAIKTIKLCVDSSRPLREFKKCGV